MNKMKLIFKIFKKIRDLKRQEKELKQNIERLKLDSNKYLKEEEIKLKRSILNLKKLEKKGWIDLHSLSKSGYLDHIKEEYKYKDKQIASEEKQLEERRKVVNQREKELNNLQEKLNDQILKLGIVQGVNK